MKIKLDTSDPETRAVWEAAQRATQETANWPAWKRGDLPASSTTLQEARPRDEQDALQRQSSNLQCQVDDLHRQIAEVAAAICGSHPEQSPGEHLVAICEHAFLLRGKVSSLEARITALAGKLGADPVQSVDADLATIEAGLTAAGATGEPVTGQKALPNTVEVKVEIGDARLRRDDGVGVTPPKRTAP